MRLDGETIVVTGGSGGLGRAMADAFVREGARVVVSGRTRSTLEEAVEEFAGPGEADWVRADVRRWDEVRTLVDRAEDRFGPVDTFLNNAGLIGQLVRGDTSTPPLAETAVETWETVLETNLRGVFLCSRAVLPGMRERGAGRLIHLSSGMGTSAKAHWGPYSASKFALEGFATTLALELADTGVASMTLRPPGGGVHTESRSGIGIEPDEMTHGPDVVSEAAVQLAAGGGTNGERYVAGAEGAVVDETT